MSKTPCLSCSTSRQRSHFSDDAASLEQDRQGVLTAGIAPKISGARRSFLKACLAFCASQGYHVASGDAQAALAFWSRMEPDNFIIRDPFFASVVLGLPMDSSVTTDVKGRTITAVASPTLSPYGSSFGTGAMTLNGGSYLSIPDHAD
jgi:hypothetical protein